MRRSSYKLKHVAGIGSPRRILVTGLLLLGLLSTQLFQFAHEFSHLKHGLLEDEGVCVTCVALKALEGSNLSAPLVLADLLPAFQQHTTPRPAPPAPQTVSPYQGRAPPFSFS